jgi:hypothetical protein
MPICPLPHRQHAQCRFAHCGTFQVGYVYGLLDARIGDIFYVGSTFQAPGIRYSGHLHAKRLTNFREAWILAILADGSFPVLLSLGEFPTECEHELKQIERAIAEDLHAQGHTALCDGGTLILHKRLSVMETSAIGSEVRWNLIEQAIAEYLDQVNEQARIQQWFREI